MKSFQGVLGNGLLQGKGRIDSSTEKVDYSLNLTGSDVQLKAIVAAAFPDIQGDFKGQTGFTIDLSSSGTTQESFNKHLKGKGDFQVKNGRVSKIEFLQSLSSFISVDNLETLAFDHSYGTFNVADELIHTTSNLKGQEIELFPEGTVSLDAYVNLALKMRIAPSLAEQLVDGVLTKYFVDADGWTILDLAIKGPVGEVSIMPGATTINSISEMFVDVLLKKGDGEGAGREDKKEALEELLKKLMKRSSEDDLAQEESTSDIQ